jgi:putative Holliday junction resolvase
VAEDSAQATFPDKIGFFKSSTNFAARFHGNDLPNAKTSENSNMGDTSRKPSGRLLALDLGEKRIGVAVSDELWMTVRPLPCLRRTSWKQLLGTVANLMQSFDAQALVIGLPLNLDGTEGLAAQEARRLARNFELSLKVPVHLQDERLTSREAEEALRAAGHLDEGLRQYVDSEAAAIILRDFIARPTGL